MAGPDSTILRISDDKTIELVELYKKEECLWDTSSPDYRIKVKRRMAAEKIAKILNIPNFEARHVMMKFKNLRNSYCQELKKIAISQNLGLDEETTLNRKGRPRPHWYTVMDSFIRPHLQANYSYSGPTLVINGGIIKRELEREQIEDPDELWDNSAPEDPPTVLPNEAEEACDVTDSGNTITYENNKRPGSSIGSNSPKRMRSEDLLAESLKEVSTQLAVLKSDLATTKATSSQKNGDFYDNFGKYVASLLRLLPIRKSLLLQPKIVNMIAAEVLEEQDDIFQ